MTTILFILAFIFCTAIASASILIGYSLIRTYSNQFLKSYFYYLISFYAFAYYGIWAQLLVRIGLSKITIDTQDASTLANFLPILGVPFLFISWVMLIKMRGQISPQISNVKKELFLHGLMVILGIIAVVLVILFELVSISIESNIIPIAPFAILLSLELVYFVFYIGNILKLKEKSQAIFTFNVLLLAGLIFRIGLFIFSTQFDLLLPLTITLYFATNLFPLVYVWRIADDYFKPLQADTADANVIDQFANRYGVTKREREVIIQISLGKTNQQIANELFISLQTVKDHTHRIYKKTSVNSRMQLIRLLNK